MLNRFFLKIKTLGLMSRSASASHLLSQLVLIAGLFACSVVNGQTNWKDVSSQFGNLPSSIKVLKSDELLDGFPSIMYVATIKAKDHAKQFFVDTTYRRRLTPSQYFSRNKQPLVVVNCSFFEFVQNRNVNLIVQNSKMVGFDTPAVSRKGRDTMTYVHTLGSAFGIFKDGKMDIAFNYNDSGMTVPYAQQSVYAPMIDSVQKLNFNHPSLAGLKPWKVKHAFGGGPVLVQDGQVKISNNEEKKFAGKAIADKHPRTAIGYTQDDTMIILAIQGRMKGLAEGATLPQMAKLMLDLGCVEAMNLDGGGSSCMLINGKETIKPSDPSGQRPVPAVLIIK
jgi:exopolysaccharide biosynthesis protein